MIDLRAARNDPNAFRAALARKGAAKIFDELLDADRAVREIQPRVEELYRLADCYVFPSSDADHAIALPLSVLEAASSGLPVVCMKFRALPEQLGGSAGVELVDGEQELTDRVLAVLRSPVARRSVAATFSWDGVADRVLTSLESLQR